jgi:glycine dehydrogenase subunit 1
MRYIALTEQDRKEMLNSLGMKTTDDLFAHIPSEIRKKQTPGLPSAKSEFELKRYFQNLSKKNISSIEWKTYLGAGCYDHFIPTVVDALSSRGEFATAYTPYQAEISQGTLQAIFEFQSMIANLFEMDVSNASMYDGASASAEAILMALRCKKGKTVYLSKGIHPEYLHVIRSYLSEIEVDLIEMDVDSSGKTVIPNLRSDTSCVVLSQPNFFGVVEDLDKATKTIKGAGALSVVVSTEVMAYGILQPPGRFGVDIVAGEGQSFGNYPSFGGPFVGLLCAKKEYLRNLPGRLVGQTKDSEGNPGYVLTLSTREQHIRRDKATSNICTNHSLCALRTAIYLSTVGHQGLREIALKNFQLSEYLKKKLETISGIQVSYTGTTFNEFVVKLPISSDAFLSKMEDSHVIPGLPLSKWFSERRNEILITVTETKTKEDLDHFVECTRKAL